jgi:thymidine kinase
MVRGFPISLGYILHNDPNRAMPNSWQYVVADNALDKRYNEPNFSVQTNMAKLHFYYSTMNAGKSTLLLQSSHNYRERGMDTLLYCPSLDHRYGVGKITSRIGLQSEAMPVGPNFDLFAHAQQYLTEHSNTQCILVDEAQFLSRRQVAQLGAICDRLNCPVLAYGIRSDFQGEPFAGSQYLLTWADILQEIKTICHCGRKATMVYRLDQNGHRVTHGAQIDIGGNEKYVSCCRKHFYEDKITTFDPQKPYEIDGTLS